MARRFRKPFLLLLLVVLFLCLSAAAVDAFLFEPTAFVTTRVSFSSSRLPDSWVGRKVVLFSDAHFGGGLRPADVEKAVAVMQAEKPDLVLFLGDAIDGFTPDDPEFLDTIGSTLASLDAQLGKFAVLGNHDAQSETHRLAFETVMRRAGFGILEDRSVEIDGLVLGGLADSHSTRPDVAETFRLSSDGAFRILMAHQPKPGMSAEVLAEAPDLVFSGHTHGGQLTFFGIPFPFIATMNGGYAYGRYEVGGTTLFVSRGIGTWGPRARFFCRPEIVVATLSR
jgi:predicted MPP superfamily phosphohydrolase